MASRKKKLRTITCCCYCGRTTQQKHRTVEHLVAKINGGNNDSFNVRMGCTYCNGEKRGMSLEEYEQFLLDKLGRVRYYIQFTKTFAHRTTSKDYITDYNPNIQLN